MTYVPARAGVTAIAVQWRTFPISGVFATNGGAAAASNELWFTGRTSLVKMAPSGAYTSYSLGDLDPTSLISGNSGRVYTTSCCTLSGDYAVVAETPSGTMHTYVPKSHDGINDGLALDRNGNFWFSEFTHVAKLSPAGAIVEYPLSLPAGLLSNNVAGITLGSDGRVWFPVNNNNESPYEGYLAAVDTSSGSVTYYPTPCFDPEPVVGGNDGNLYAACRTVNSTKVGILRMTTSGAASVFSDPFGITFGGNAMVAVSNGIYFVTFTGGAHPNSLGFFNATTGETVEVVPPAGEGGLSALTRTPSGPLWGLTADEDALEYFRN